MGVTGTIEVYRLLSKNQLSIAVAALIIGADFLLVTVSLTVLMQLPASTSSDTVSRNLCFDGISAVTKTGRAVGVGSLLLE